MLIGQAQAVGIEAKAERKVKTPVQQPQCQLRLTPKAMYDTPHTRCATHPEYFVIGFYAVNEQRFAHLFRQLYLSLETSQLGTPIAPANLVKSAFAYK